MIILDNKYIGLFVLVISFQILHQRYEFPSLIACVILG